MSRKKGFARFETIIPRMWLLPPASVWACTFGR
jgi:hypothetical protein